VRSARKAATLACALAWALMCAACGHSAHRAAGRPASAVAQADATHEYPSKPPPPESARDAAPTAVQAIRAFVTAYINWDAPTVAGTMRTLAADSIGQARAAMTLAAAETAGDYELRRGGIANSGVVEAVAPLEGHRDQFVVVTRESTTATNTTTYQGLRPAWHVALATVQQVPGGRWVLSDWQPES
jgi:hypothetical protein